jgi:hypothetical protein
MKFRSKFVTAIAVTGGAVLSLGASVAPVSATDGWHHIGVYKTAHDCDTQGRAYVNAGWAVRYECRPYQGTNRDLWVVSNA